MNCEKYADPDYCMCGSRIDAHSMSDNHAPVSQMDWCLEQRSKKMKIYYAHPMSWYNTKEELDDIVAISKEWDAEIINPNSMKFEAKVQLALIENRNTMQIFLDAIKAEADAVVFRSFNDGFIGTGVAREIFEAFIWERPVYEVVGTDKPYVWQVPAQFSVLSRTLPYIRTKGRIRRGTL